MKIDSVYRCQNGTSLIPRTVGLQFGEEISQEMHLAAHAYTILLLTIGTETPDVFVNTMKLHRMNQMMNVSVLIMKQQQQRRYVTVLQ